MTTSAASQRWLPVRPHPALHTAYAHLRKHGFKILAAHPTPDARHFPDIDLPQPTARVVGAERYGLSKGAVAQANERVLIPV